MVRWDCLQCYGWSQGGTNYSAIESPGGPLLGGITYSLTYQTPQQHAIFVFSFSLHNFSFHFCVVVIVAPFPHITPFPNPRPLSQNMQYKFIIQ